MELKFLLANFNESLINQFEINPEWTMDTMSLSVFDRYETDDR